MKQLILFAMIFTLLVGCNDNEPMPDSTKDISDEQIVNKDILNENEDSSNEVLDITFPSEIYYNHWSEGYNKVEQVEWTLPEEQQQKADSINEKINNNLELTDDENQFIATLEQHKTLVKVSEVGLKIIKFEDRIILEGEGTKFIRSIEIDLIANKLKTNYGTLIYMPSTGESKSSFIKNMHTWEIEQPFINSNLTISFGNTVDRKKSVIHLKWLSTDTVDENIISEEILLL